MKKMYSASMLGLVFLGTLVLLYGFNTTAVLASSTCVTNSDCNNNDKWCEHNTVHRGLCDDECYIDHYDDCDIPTGGTCIEDGNDAECFYCPPCEDEEGPLYCSPDLSWIMRDYNNRYCDTEEPVFGTGLFECGDDWTYGIEIEYKPPNNWSDILDCYWVNDTLNSGWQELAWVCTTPTIPPWWISDPQDNWLYYETCEDFFGPITCRWIYDPVVDLQTGRVWEFRKCGLYDGCGHYPPVWQKLESCEGSYGDDYCENGDGNEGDVVHDWYEPECDGDECGVSNEPNETVTVETCGSSTPFCIGVGESAECVQCINHIDCDGFNNPTCNGDTYEYEACGANICWELEYDCNEVDTCMDTTTMYADFICSTSQVCVFDQIVYCDPMSEVCTENPLADCTPV